jgi:hypothetical protein
MMSSAAQATLHEPLANQKGVTTTNNDNRMQLKD